MTDARLAADVESSVELLRTIAAVLDIRDVFPRVSEIANKVLAHDLLTMMFHDGHGQILIEAASTDEFRGLSRFTKTDGSEPPDGFIIIDDLTTAIYAPTITNERLAGFGRDVVDAAKAKDRVAEQIVADGADRLRDGSAVKVQPQGTARVRTSFTSVRTEADLIGETPA